jgi:hypothetical protein
MQEGPHISAGTVSTALLFSCLISVISDYGFYFMLEEDGSSSLAVAEASTFAVEGKAMPKVSMKQAESLCWILPKRRMTSDYTMLYPRR